MATSSPHLELHICHILQASKKYDICHVLFINDQNACSTLNPFGRNAISKNIQQRNNEIEYFLKDKKNIVFNQINLKDLSNNKNLSSLKSKIKRKIGNNLMKEINSELEIAVYSGIASYTRICSVKELPKKWIKASKNLFCTSLQLFDFFLNYIKTNNIDNSYCFNGRFSCAKALTLSSKHLGINYYVYDLNRGHNHYIFKNKSLHSIQENTDRAKNLYKKNIKLAEITAKKFYSNRRIGNFTYEESFTLHQKKGKTDINSKNKIITIYTSSDDEYSFIGKEWDGEKPLDQVNEIREICRKLNKNFKIVVKMHPNQFNIPKIKMNEYKRKLKHLCTLLLPSSKVDTYALMDKSEIIITFVSLMGPEAIYHSKKTLTIGPCPYMKLNIGNNAKNAEEAIKIINSGNFNNDKKGAIIWANYLMNYEDKLNGFKNHKNRLFTIYDEKWPVKKPSIGLLLAKAEIFISRVNIFSFFNIKTIKLLNLKLRTNIDGFVRGDHELK